MIEYYIDGSSNAAPFFGDSIGGYVTASSPQAALQQFINSNPHPCGVYALACYASADDKMKGHKPLAQWMSSKALQQHGVQGGAFV